jgi:hypothetical protein
MGAGYDGHARKCECAPCVKRRVADYLDRINDASRMVPASTSHSVAARAHWRMCPNHLKKQPKFKAALDKQLASLIRKGNT